MIECMTAASARDGYAWACRRAAASSRKGSTEWPDFAPPVALSDGPLGVVQAADRELARQTAIRARGIAEFAASRPATSDRSQGEPGAMSPERWAARPEVLRDVSEWAAQELVVALSISAPAAETLLVRSLTLVHRLPGTLAALEAGALHPGHLWPMLEKVAPIENDTVRAEVEAELLRWSAGRVTTPAQLGAKARREVLRRDARAAARQLEKAIKERGVHVRPGGVDGMATVTALLTTPEAHALVRALGEYADALPADPDGPPRTRGQKMADCLLDLVLRPGECNLPPVQILLHVVASVGTLAGGDEPGEVDGHVVPAEMIRELVRALGPRPTTELPGRPTGDQPAPATATVGQQIAGAEQIDDAEPALGLQPGWEHIEQLELERWWAETERRVLADELGPGPEYGPDPDVPLWISEDCAPPDWDVVDDPVRHDEILARQLADQAAQDAHAGDTAAAAGATHESAPATPGWWSTADRAVGEAGLAVLRAHEAIANAGRLVRTAGAADAADETEWQAGPGGRVGAAADALTGLGSATDAQRAQLADLLSATGGGGLVDRPRIALTDAVTGALLALTDLPAMRRAATCGATACRRSPDRCAHDLTDRPGLGPPGPTDGYRPSAPLDRWVRARDRRCRFPGCRRRVPRGGELDHDRPYPSGPTSAENLAGYCTAHHRGKHQAPGWRHALAPDGTLTVTTPTGLTAVTALAPY
jgi:hypothetical protein